MTSGANVIGWLGSALLTMACVAAIVANGIRKSHSNDRGNPPIA